MNKVEKAGRVKALRVVSRGIVDDLFAFRFRLSANKFRWRQAKELGERKHTAEKMLGAVGKQRQAKELASRIDNPQIKQFVLDVGNVKHLSFAERKRINDLVRNVFMAELRGGHKDALAYIHQAKTIGFLK